MNLTNIAMCNRTKLLMAAVAVVLALTLGAATANASRSFSASNGAALAYIGPQLSFNHGSELQFICDLTLTASIHSLVAKTRRALLGYVSGARSGRCRSAFTGTVLVPLVSSASPWHLMFESFRGTLPRITEVLFVIDQAKWLTGRNEAFGTGFVGCLYVGDMAMETRGRSGAAEYTAEALITQNRYTPILFEDGLSEGLVELCEESFELIGQWLAVLPVVFRLI
jgi:hypothetical protein